MARNEIRIAGKVFSDKSITSGKITLQSSLPNDELTVDVFNATIDGSAPRGTRFVPKGSSALITAGQKLFMVMPYIRVLVSDPTIYRYGEVVGFYRNGVLFRKFYMNTSRRIGKFEYEISCISDIGLLESSKHYGGVYRGLLLKDLMADIIGDAFPYTVDISVQNISIYGWLPVATRRENLHQVIFAHGISVKRDANGDPVFSVLSKDDPSIIGKDRMFIGGKIKNESLATRADVTEHVYVALDTDDSATLFDGQVIAEDIVSPKGQNLSGAVILFQDPAHTLSASGAQVLESGDNYAVLSQGSNVKLTGKKYTHITRVVTKYPKIPASRSLVDFKDNVVSVDNATLVSFTNAESVAERMIAYYGFAKSVDVGITVGQEMPGDPISFEDPWGDINAGFIEGMNITLSATLKASAQLLAGYIPPDPGGYYTRFVILTGTGTWTVPDGVTRIRVVLIGGGQGGTSGEAGKPGEPTRLVEISDSRSKAKGYVHGISGPGGAGGTGGIGAKIYQFTMDVTPGSEHAVSIGPGGSGGGPGNKIPGSMGGDTSFDSYSSRDGSVSANGYVNILTGVVYARASTISGTPGGRGTGTLQDGGELVYGNTVAGYSPGQKGEDVEDYNLPRVATSGGGYGGGAAVGANGANGTAGIAVVSGYTVKAQGGRGGDGATPAISPTSPTVIGNGGHGGHGGGGGGGSGPGVTQMRDTSSPASLQPTLPGMSSGGNGGKGGSGAQGGIIVYF